jgi:hypothetical protein
MGWLHVCMLKLSCLFYIFSQEYKEEVYPQVSANLNELGKLALEKIHPWILNTLVDWDNFDKLICSKEVEGMDILIGLTNMNIVLYTCKLLLSPV